MMTITKSRVFAAIILAVAASTFAVGQDAIAQNGGIIIGDILIDHFKIYDLDPTLIFSGPVSLTDQFDNYSVGVEGPFRLGVPTDVTFAPPTPGS